MKPIVLFVAVCMLVPGCAPQKSAPVEGAWKLVYATYTKSDSLMEVFPGKGTGSDMKIWTRSHFLFVGRYKLDTTVTVSYGGGTYLLEGDRYQENIMYHARTPYIGETIKMLLEVKNDTLVQTWPLQGNGQLDRSNFRQEKYVRLD